MGPSADADRTRDGEPADGPPPLRVALDIVGTHGPAWFESVVRAILEGGDVEIVGVTSSGGADGRGGTGRLGSALLDAYGRVDQRLFGRSDDPDRIVDLRPILDECRALIAQQSAGGGPADVVLRLGSRRRLETNTTKTASRAKPRFGTWEIDQGAGLPDGLRPDRLGIVPGGPELLTGRSFTISRLVVELDGGDRRAIGQVVSSVDRLSMKRGARGHLRKLPGLVARSLRATRLDGALPDAASGRDEPGGTADRGLAARPAVRLGTFAIGLALAGAFAGFFARRALRTMSPERWVVAISRTAPADDPGSIVRHNPRLLQAPAGHEWADPFPVAVGGGQLLFVEEYITHTGKGRLAVVELDDSARGWRSIETVLEGPRHLSYPCVFQWQDGWYLLPEQASTGSLELYRATDFPRGWVWHSTVLPGVAAADATIAEIDGRWWLFAAETVAGGNAADELHLFHSDSPLGPWTAHDRNPVVSDVRTARPAGRLFQRDGRWYRPAQDGAVTYGHSIAILEIERLDLTGYRQRVIEVIRPTWRPLLVATHTLNALDGLSVIDGLERRSRLPLPRPRR